MNVPSTNFEVIYQGRNITRDIAPLVKSVRYIDNVAGKADTLSLELDDTEYLWQTTWYPAKGDTIIFRAGFEALVELGIFQVDEIELRLGPDTLTIDAIAAPVNIPLRTRRTVTYEAQTLAQIASKVARQNGLQVWGDLGQIQVARATQNRETDLNFLARIAQEYGRVFSVKDGKIIFITVYDLEARAAVETLSRADIIQFSARDKISQVFASARVNYHDPLTGRFVSATEQGSDESADVCEDYCRAENEGQAKDKAKALVHQNTKQVKAQITVSGNPYLVAGNNVTLTQLGQFSGLYHIVSSEHSIAESWTTSLELKRVGTVSADLQKPPARVVL